MIQNKFLSFSLQCQFTKPCADLSQKKTPICQQLNCVSPANGILGNSDTGWCTSIVASWMLRGKVKIHFTNKELIIAWIETLRDAHTLIHMRVETDHSGIENSPQWHISLTSYSLVDLHLSRALKHSPAALLSSPSLHSASKHRRKAEIIFNSPHCKPRFWFNSKRLSTYYLNVSNLLTLLVNSD